MNEIEKMARDLVRKEDKYGYLNYDAAFDALCRAIEQNEAFKQEVSEVMTYIKALYPTLPRNFNRFIIPAPKPDPLVEVLHEVDTGLEWDSPEDYCNKIRAALEARGLEIKEKSNDD
jgi:hypothetical protein